MHNSCFFKGAAATDATWLIANPPYIPAEDNGILMPALHGGQDGANLTRVRSDSYMVLNENHSELVVWKTAQCFV